jgi:N-acetylmuramoyl-L-alanine amidase
VVTFQTNTASISYHAELSSDQCNLYIDVYKNCLTSISAGTYSAQEILVLTGAMELDYSYTTENNLLQFTFPHTMSGIDTKEFAAENSSFVKNVAISEQVDQSLLVTVAYEGKFYLQVSEANIQVIFYQPAAGTQNNDGDSTGTDSASFDIYIPLPDDVKYKKITDKDPYADKSFQILIPGNYVDFFKKNPVISNNKTVKKN